MESSRSATVATGTTTVTLIGGRGITYRRHGHHGFFPRHGGFYFNFPFPRPYAYYHRRPRCHDLVLGYDGRWHCYRGW